MADGLFSGLGVDTRSQAEILQQRQHDRRREFENYVPRERGLPSEQTLFRAGGGLATALRNRFAPDQLPQSQQNQTNAVSTAKQRFAQWKTDNPSATIEDQGLASQRMLAEELLKVGDPNGIAISQAYAKTAQAKRMADLQIEQLEGAVAEQKIEQDNWRMINTLKTVWPTDAKFGDGGREAFIKEDGSASYFDDNGQEVIIPRGQYTRYDPERPLAGRGGAGAKPSDYGWTPTQIGNARQLGINIPRAAQSLINMQKALKDSVASNGTVNFLGSAGKTQSWVSDVANTTSALARSARYFLTVEGKNLATDAGASSYVRERPELVEALTVHMPENIRNDTLARARWATAAVQLAFSRGQSLEPGQRNMSDQDFQIQIENIASLTTDPEAFRQVSMQNFQGDWDNFQLTYDTAPPEIQKMMLSPSSLKKIQESRAAFDQAFAEPFGTADEPGPGIQPGNQGVLTFDPETGTVR
jgi:hypothetical protein